MDERDRKAMNKDTQGNDLLAVVRVRFYLCDFDEDIWCIMPCRVNKGDSFYMDSFISKEDEKRLRQSTTNSIYNDNTILDCESVIFGQDEQGIYQQVYLTSADLNAL